MATKGKAAGLRTRAASNQNFSDLNASRFTDAAADCEGCGIRLRGNPRRCCHTRAQWAIAINAIVVVRRALEAAR
jgi:hypothetical protein